MRKASNHIYLIILLSILSTVAPMGVDTYLPSIPTIASYFDVNIHKVELSLPIFLLGLSVGQIFGGPISDKYGRKKSSIFGLLGYAFFSFIIIFSTSIYELWFYRFLEAFFGGIVMVNALASVRDRFHGQEAAKVYSLMGMVRSIAPLLAPVIGAFIIHFFSWKVVFVFLTLYALIVALLVYKTLEESYTYIQQSVFQSYKTVLSNLKALKVMIALGISFGGFFIVISKTSFIYIEYFKIQTDYFPFFFGINFVLLIIMMKVNIHLLQTISAVKLVKSALVIQTITTFIFTLLSQDINLLTMVIIIAIYMSFMSFIFGNCMSLALDYFQKNAGVASGVIGVLQFGLGALISSIALSFHDDTFFTIAFSLFLISIVSFLIIKSYEK
ncbi:multidrug effflux MFS transporter [Arcobacteraceae bacterium]|nr:multidrug effflux MFS transporter [Arcobacteraceae bacterium]